MTEYYIRPAKKTELPAIVKLLIRIWQEQYSSFLPPTFLQKMDFERQLQRHTAYFEKSTNYLIVENSSKEIVGFCSFGKNRDSFPIAKWELYTLYVSPEQQGRGIGGKLIQEIQHQLKQGEEMAVWVMQENPFRHFYEKMGFKLVGQRKVDMGEFEVVHWVMKCRLHNE